MDVESQNMQNGEIEEMKEKEHEKVPLKWQSPGLILNDIQGLDGNRIVVDYVMQSPKSDENLELKADCIKDPQMASPKLKGSPPKDLNKKQVQSKNSFQLIQEALDATSKSIEKLQQHKGKVQLTASSQQAGESSPLVNNSQNSSCSKDSGYSGPVSIVAGSNNSS